MVAQLTLKGKQKMTFHDISLTRKSGKISHAGREVIVYSIEIPEIADEKFPNSLFADTAQGYAEYLEALAENELFPELDRLISEQKRLREIRRELGIPINASLGWRFSFLGNKYLSARCETMLEYSNNKRLFTLRALTFDTENMTLKKARDFSKREKRRKYSFYLSGSKLCTFEKSSAFTEKNDSAGALMGLRICKIDNIEVQNL